MEVDCKWVHRPWQNRVHLIKPPENSVHFIINFLFIYFFFTPPHFKSLSQPMRVVYGRSLVLNFVGAATVFRSVQHPVCELMQHRQYSIIPVYFSRFNIFFYITLHFSLIFLVPFSWPFFSSCREMLRFFSRFSNSCKTKKKTSYL